jgi:hypothetical protein
MGRLCRIQWHTDIFHTSVAKGVSEWHRRRASGSRPITVIVTIAITSDFPTTSTIYRRTTLHIQKGRPNLYMTRCISLYKCPQA